MTCSVYSDNMTQLEMIEVVNEFTNGSAKIILTLPYFVSIIIKRCIKDELL